MVKVVNNDKRYVVTPIYRAIVWHVKIGLGVSGENNKSGMRKTVRAVQQAKRDVREECGLELANQLQWSKWQAGGEFIKVLCVKNVCTDVVRFTYKLLPSSCAFSVDFPHTYRLSPGMAATIPVTFRPAVRQSHTSQLELLCGRASIFVPLQAVLPASKLQLPAAVDFGCVPAKEPVTQQLPIRNVGDAPLRFSWTLGEPFAVVPAAGQLNPGQTAMCEVRFQPQDAAAYRGSAACSLDNGELLTVQVHGMAKFPFLSLERELVDLGDVVVGLAGEALVRFGNHSAVPAHFRLAPAGGFDDGVFSIQPTQGTLQPNEYSVVRVVFRPRATGTFSCQSFSLSTPGSNRLTLTCQGAAVGPQLRLSSRVFNFGSVRAGHSPSQVLYLENGSDLPLQFEFLAEPGSVFALTKAKGAVAPRSMTHTSVCFSAAAPGNYWRRLVCLVKDSEPVAIDALASCFDDKLRPPPLSYKAIAAHLDRVAAGGPAVPPELASSSSSGSGGGGGHAAAAGSQAGSRASPANTLAPANSAAAALTEDAPDATQQGQQQAQQGSSSGSSLSMTVALQSQLAPQLLPGPDSWAALFDGLDAGAALTLSDSQLDFGSCSRLAPCEPRSFTVHNNTGAKLLVSLLVPSWQDQAQAGQDAQQKPVKVLQAFPESFELRPHSSATVRLAFRPPLDGRHYCQSLLLMAGLKAMRSFRLVPEGGLVVPPWSLSILATGDTFASVRADCLPKVSLSSSSIAFPPCRPGEAVHQTLCLSNNGDMPVHFAFAAAGAAAGGASAAAAAHTSSAGQAAAAVACFGPFAVLPCQGLLQPNSSRLVALRFRPQDLQPAQLKLLCVFNHSSSSSSTVLLSGAASEPRLAWDVGPEGQLFFRPTCVGASSQRVVTVTNASRVAVGWQWVLSKKLQDAVAVQPERGVLRGGEQVKVIISFTPLRQVTYNARAALLMLPPSAVQSAGAPSGAAQAGPSLLSITAAGMESEQAALATGVPAAAATSAAADDDDDDGEKLVLTVLAEATQGALSVEPCSISFGVVNVGYPQHRALRLVNSSGGVFRYSIELVNKAPGAVDLSGAACDFDATCSKALLAPAAACSHAGSDGGSRGSSPLPQLLQGGEEQQELCWVDEPQGVVNARASKTINLTLLPRQRGEYRLRLNLRACSLPQLPPLAAAAHGGVRSTSAGSASSIPASLGSGLAAVVPVSAGGAADALLAAADRPPLATAAVTTSARFPALLLTDVVCDGLPKQVAWQMLGVQQLNTELRSAVSSAELQALQLCDRGSLTNDNAAALLPPFALDLGVLGVGAGRRCFWVCLSNEGSLPLSWELHSYDKPQVELENWVEPARPLTDAERARAFILDSAIFGVSQRAGCLQPGGSDRVCFTFNPVAEGAFQLPLFLRVKDGKQLQLQLTGRAVLPSAQLPLVVRGSQSCVLAASPIGELDPPLQCHTLRNGGPAALQYRLDISPLQQLARQNFDAEIIKYAGGSPLVGEVPPGDVAVFNFLFQPLEARDYSVVLPLALGAAGPQPLLLRGRGYHPLQHPEQGLPNEEEAALDWRNWLGFTGGPRVLPPGQILRLSDESLDLGACLPARTSRRLLVLENAGGRPLEFVWDLGAFQEERRTISGRLAIVPATGVLEPGESRVCQFSFEAGLQPQIFSAEVFCHARCVADTSTGTQQLETGPGDDEQQEEPDEEIIAQHPTLPPVRRSALRDKLRCRLPLHLSMTEATCARFELLKQRYTQAVQLQKLTLQQHPHATFGALSTSALQAAAAASESGGGTTALSSCSVGGSAGQGQEGTLQLVAVAVQGAVLSKAHIRAGSYMSPQQQQDAAQLLAVAEMLPPVEQPVSLLLPPGSMGVGKAAAAAAASTAAATAAAEPDQAGLAVAGEVLQGLLGEVWAEGEVAAAFDHLEPAPVHVFAQLQQQQQQEECEAQQIGPPAAAMDDAAAGSRDAGDGGRQHEELSEEAAELSGAGTGQQAAAADDVAQVLQQPQFHAFAEFVLDSALLGALQEGVVEAAGLGGSPPQQQQQQG